MLKTNFKRILCLCLALVMLSSFTCFAFAEDGNEVQPTLTVTTKFYRLDENTSDWVETEKVIGGEAVKARVFVDTDYYAGVSTLLFFYSKDIFEDSYEKNTIIDFALNKEDGSYADTYNASSYVVIYDSDSKYINQMVSQGVITSDFAQKHQCVLFSILLSELNCCKFNGDKYLFEFDLTVKETSEICEGDFFVVPETVATPENPRGVCNVPVGTEDTPIGDAVPFFAEAISVELNSNPVKNYSTVTFDADGGTFANGKETYTENVVIGSEIDESLFASPEKTGHFFLGWDEEFPATMSAEDLTFTAEWKAAESSIIYYSDENKVFASHGGSYGVKVPVLKDIPEKEGYEFVGWDKEIPETFPAENYRVYAIWKAKEYTVTWVVDGVETTETVPFGEAITVPAAPEKTGYVFVGWDNEIPATMPAKNLTFTAEWKAMESSIIYYSDENKVFASHGGSYGVQVPELKDIPEKEGYEFAGWDKEIPETFPAENYRVYAIWKAKEYTVTWVVDGVENETAVAYGEAITEPLTPVKEGFVFVGWDKKIPAAMPAENLTFTALFEKACICPYCGEKIAESKFGSHTEAEKRMRATVVIRENPGSTSLAYGDSIELTAVFTDKPEDVKIVWYVNGSKKGEGETFTYTPDGTVEITVKLVDANGNALKNSDGNEISDSENINVKTGFFQKIIAFFKKLFGLTKTVIQAYYKA